MRLRKRRPQPPYQGQHDYPHDEASCGRCVWLRWQDGGYRYEADRDPVTREDIDRSVDSVLKRLTEGIEKEMRSSNE